MNQVQILAKTFLVAIFFLMLGQVVNAAPAFLFSVPEGQGGSGNEFYHGRCVRADVMLNTDGSNTGGADLEINYDNTRVAIVNNNCTTAASQIYHDSQYQNYVNNTVTTNKITLGAYNGPGVPYNGNGRFASFYFTVLDGAGLYDLDFEFTVGDTTDTNLAEYGTGNDILGSATDYTLSFADDNDVPYATNLNPVANATTVAVNSNIRFRVSDDDAGININTLAVSLAGANYGTENYTVNSGQVSYSCHTTNTNRVDYCDITINPTKNLYYCENYTVIMSVSDLGNPTVHTLTNYTYTFDTEPDNDSPTLYNRSPDNGSASAGASTNVNFSLHDIASPGGYPGTGVNISTLNVVVSAPNWGTQTYTTASNEITTTPAGTNDYGNVYNYNISINPTTDFPENTLVTVQVTASDYGCPTIDTLNEAYTFRTADTIGPVCTLFSPDRNAVDMGTADNITFHCTDSGSGVDIGSARFFVDNIMYTAAGSNQFSYTGTAADYFITINPNSDVALNYALEVILNIADISGNQASQVSYGLATGVEGTCQTCPETEECEECEKCDDCEECDDEDFEDSCEPIVQTKTEYQQCQALGNRDYLTGSKIANTQINKIELIKIDKTEIHINKRLIEKIVTTLVRDETQALVTVKGDKVVFEGMALPNTQVTLMIESEPFIITGLANDQGEWTIEMSNIFTNGIHKVSAVVLSEDNYIVKVKHLANFKVTKHTNNWCWIIIIILCTIIIIIYRKYRKFKNKYCQVVPAECKKGSIKLVP